MEILAVMPNIPPAVSGAMLGLVAGSFLATLLVRWPAGRSVLTGRSTCDSCGTPVAARDLVPLLSHAMLRGRTRCCGAPIATIHLQVEIGAALIGVVSFAVAGWQGWQAALFGWLLMTLALFDLRHFWLPDPLTALLAASGLLTGLVSPVPSITDRLIGGGAGFAVLAIIGWGYRRLRGRDGLGGGDPKLLGAIGLWTGWEMLPAIMVAASLIGLAAALVGHLCGRTVSATTRLPLGTLLAAAAWPIWLFAQN